MGCEVERKSTMLEKIWKIESKPYWFYILFPIVAKEKKKESAWISLNVYLNKFLAEC